MNADALAYLASKGLSLEEVIEFARIAEKRRDPTAAERKQRQRERDKSRRDVTRDAPPIDNNHTPPVSSQPSVSKKAANQFPPPDGVEDQLWGDFLANRKRHKAPLTRTAYDRICKTLIESREAGYPPGEVVGRAVERGWRTVFNPAEGEQNGRLPNDRRPSAERRNPAFDMYAEAEAEARALYGGEGDDSGPIEALPAPQQYQS